MYNIKCYRHMQLCSAFIQEPGIQTQVLMLVHIAVLPTKTISLSPKIEFETSHLIGDKKIQHVYLHRTNKLKIQEVKLGHIFMVSQMKKAELLSPGHVTLPSTLCCQDTLHSDTLWSCVYMFGSPKPLFLLYVKHITGFFFCIPCTCRTVILVTHKWFASQAEGKGQKTAGYIVAVVSSKCLQCVLPVEFTEVLAWSSSFTTQILSQMSLVHTELESTDWI